MDFEEICRQGDLNKVQEFIDQHRSGILDWNDGLYGACRGGHITIVRLMIGKGATNVDWGLNRACEGGHMDIVHLMIERDAAHWGWGLIGACRGGHVGLVNFMIEKGIEDLDFQYAIYEACRGRHSKVIETLLDRCDTGLHHFNRFLSCDEQFQVYELVANATRLKLEQTPKIRGRMRYTSILVLDKKLPDHVILAIVEFL